MKLQKIKLPKFNMSKVRLPKIKLPKLNFSASQKSNKPSKPFIDDARSIFRSYRGQMIRISVLSGFLLFLLNILIGISMYGKNLNDSLTDKLGMYFYLNDNVEDSGQMYKQVLKLKEKLEREGLHVNFLSKEDAMDFMMKRLPELTGSLEKFGITNPLPATLYVTFENNSQYGVLQSVMLDNKDIILNIQDLDQFENLKEQENRAKNVIQLSNFVQILAISLVIVIAAVILSFAVFFLRSIFNTFWHDIQVKKLLGASKSQIIMPFLWLILYAIIGGFLVSLLLTFVSLGIFDYYMSVLFSATLTSYLIVNWGLILLLFIVEIIAIVGLLMGVSYVFVSKLHKRLK